MGDDLLLLVPDYYPDGGRSGITSRSSVDVDYCLHVTPGIVSVRNCRSVPDSPSLPFETRSRAVISGNPGKVPARLWQLPSLAAFSLRHKLPPPAGRCRLHVAAASLSGWPLPPSASPGRRKAACDSSAIRTQLSSVRFPGRRRFWPSSRPAP